MQKVLLIRQWFKHMGIHSGYDNVFHYLTDQKPAFFESIHRENNKKTDPISFIIGKLLKSRINQTSFYRDSAIKLEYNAFKRAKLDDISTIHFTYLENNYALFNHDYFLNKLKGKKVIGTIHQPMSWWKENGDLNFLKKLDSLITLSEHEKSLFEPILPGKVHAIQHAVSTDFFKPPTFEKPEGFRCATIGYWMRDYATLNKIITTVRSKLPDIQFDILYNKKIEENPYLKPLLDFEQVHFHTKISDEELLSIYHNTDILLLPLLDCTANNALLEGTACGLPIITNDVGGVRSYTDESFTSYLKKGDAESMVNKILEGYENKKELQSKSKFARNYSEQNLSLEVIGDKLLNLYKDLNED